MNTQEKIDILFDNFKEFLKEKNRRYGDSATQPCKIFSKLDAVNSILIRCDDKLNRIMNSKDGIKKSDLSDLFGYIALYMITQDWVSFDEEID